jgi:uncharacterized membrane protein YhaH (DUF805 family)
MADCYYLDGARNQQGPVPADEIARLIRSGTIRRDTMIWYAGMPDWLPASQVREFAPLFAQAAPPPRPAAAQYAQYDAAKRMGFIGAIKTCFYKYADFKGRARRPEYWWWTLFNVLLSIPLALLDVAIEGANGRGMLSNLVSLALLLPSLAVGARRLHDTDRRGWWQLLWFIPLIGWIIVIVFLCQRGTEGPNRFGPDDDDLAVAAEFD